MSHFLAQNFSKSRQRKKSTPKMTKFLILRNLVILNLFWKIFSECKSTDVINVKKFDIIGVPDL